MLRLFAMMNAALVTYLNVISTQIVVTLAPPAAAAAAAAIFQVKPGQLGLTTALSTVFVFGFITLNMTLKLMDVSLAMTLRATGMCHHSMIDAAAAANTSPQPKAYRRLDATTINYLVHRFY